MTISVFVPNYNRSALLIRTVQSALESSVGFEDEISITVVDDCSTDAHAVDALRILQEEWGVPVVRHPKNLGQVSNLNYCIEICETDWIHILHSDDFVEKGFYSEMLELIRSFPECVAAFCVSRYTSSEGAGHHSEVLASDKTSMKMLPRLYERQLIQTPSIVWQPRCCGVAMKFKELNCMEDWEMWVRLARFGNFAFSPKILANYWISRASNTNGSLLEGTRQQTASLLLKTWYGIHRDEGVYERGELNVHSAIARQYASLPLQEHLKGCLNLLFTSNFWSTKFQTMKLSAMSICRVFLTRPLK